MSRVRLDQKSETSAYAWFMECDKCGHRDATAYPGRSNQPPLYRFHLLGWTIGSKGDRCPNCTAATPLPHDWERHFTPARLEEMREAAAALVKTKLQARILEGLTDEEIGTLLPPKPGTPTLEV